MEFDGFSLSINIYVLFHSLIILFVLYALASEVQSSTGFSKNGEIQYTKDPEEARIEHEKELERLKEDCEVDSPPIESLQEVLKLTQQQALPQNPQSRNLDKTLEVSSGIVEANDLDVLAAFHSSNLSCEYELCQTKIITSVLT